MFCNSDGHQFVSIESAIAWIKAGANSFMKIVIDDDMVDKLLQFEVVNFGEKDCEDMTFHVDILRRV